MRRAVTVPVAIVGFGAVLALGFAVAAFGSSSSSTAPVTTGEVGTTETSTTEQPSTTKFAAALSVRAEVPRPIGVSTAAGGRFSVTLKHSGSKYSLTWKLTFHNLTGKPTAAHIHRGKVGKAGPVLVSLCGPCRSTQSGKASVSASAASAMMSGRTYANVHTAKNPNGEIRGQLRELNQ